MTGWCWCGLAGLPSVHGVASARPGCRASRRRRAACWQVMPAMRASLDTMPTYSLGGTVLTSMSARAMAQGYAKPRSPGSGPLAATASCTIAAAREGLDWQGADSSSSRRWPVCSIPQAHINRGVPASAGRQLRACPSRTVCPRLHVLASIFHPAFVQLRRAVAGQDLVHTAACKHHRHADACSGRHAGCGVQKA